MNQNSYFPPPPVRRKPMTTCVANPEWSSANPEEPPPPYSIYEEQTSPGPGIRPAHTMPLQTSYSPEMQNSSPGYFNSGYSPRPASRGQYQNPGPSQMLHPPNRLRVMTSMPNLFTTGGFDPSPISLSPSPLSTIGPVSPSSLYIAETSPVGSPWTQRPITPSYRPATPNKQARIRPSSTTDPTTATNNNNNNTTTKSLFQTALSSTLHFAGGLIPHPTESTKHYTILRHSPALIFYRGPATSLAITIFSSPSHPLPAPSGRSVWLQQRGFTGDSGMKLKALVGATSSWMEVTPSLQVESNDLKPDTERAWTRDIDRARRRLTKDQPSEAKTHHPRETHVVRIPEGCGDGYFRLVLCSNEGGKRKNLCNSPIFRVASTSTDSSVFRGASLSTMPLEVGVKVASVVASSTVNRYVGPVAGRIQGGLDKIRPGLVAREVGGRVLGAAGGRLGAAGRGDPGERRYLGVDDMGGGGGMVGTGVGTVIGPEEGPETPFPIKFQGRVSPGTGRSSAEMGMPTANLAGVAEDIRHNLMGVYFGWACVVPGRGVDPSIIAENCWYEAIIMAVPSAYASVIAETEVKVYLAHDFGDGANFTESKMKVIIMGFIRPHVQPAAGTVASVQDRVEMASQDVLVTMASLSRENWGPDMTLGRLRTAKSARSLSDKFLDARVKVQRQVSKVPVHMAGIRTPDGEMRDKIHGIGGYWVARS